MEQNDPMPATDAVAIIAETDEPEPMRPGKTYYVNANGVLTELPPAAPAPTWRRANRGELALWFALGMGAMVVLTVIAAAVWTIVAVAL